MKIIHVAPRFFPYVGGVENYIYYLSKELVRRGHSVSVVCANEPRLEARQCIDGIRVKRLGYICKIANTNITPTLLAVLLKEDFDIIHTHIPDPYGAIMSVFAAFIKNKPLVVTYHNDIVGSGVYRYIAGLFNRLFLRFVLGQAHTIIITHAQYAEYSPHLKRYSKKISVVPLGVEVNEFGISVSRDYCDKVVLFLGLLDEFHRYKGLTHLIRSMNIVRGKVHNAKLYVGGEGMLKDEYQQLVSSLNLDDSVKFIGFVPPEELANFYSHGDVFVLPSTSREQEGFGIVLLEAMAAGVAVVTTDIVGTARDILENSSGMIVPAGDEAALADAIISILQNKELAQLMGENGRKLVSRNYDWRIIAEKIIGIYTAARV